MTGGAGGLLTPPQIIDVALAASRADGAGDSGLSHLLWVNALHAAGDAMIAVSGFDGMNGGWVRVSHTPNLLVTPPHRPRPSQRKGSGPGTAQSVDVLRSLRLGQVGG